jgi:hypothetical protein
MLFVANSVVIGNGDYTDEVRKYTVGLKIFDKQRAAALKDENQISTSFIQLCGGD